MSVSVEDLSYRQLQRALVHFNLKGSGKTEDLQKRLKDYLARNKDAKLPQLDGESEDGDQQAKGSYEDADHEEEAIDAVDEEQDEDEEVDEAVEEAEDEEIDEEDYEDEEDEEEDEEAEILGVLVRRGRGGSRVPVDRSKGAEEEEEEEAGDDVVDFIPADDFVAQFDEEDDEDEQDFEDALSGEPKEDADDDAESKPKRRFHSLSSAMRQNNIAFLVATLLLFFEILITVTEAATTTEPENIPWYYSLSVYLGLLVALPVYIGLMIGEYTKPDSVLGFAVTRYTVYYMLRAWPVLNVISTYTAFSLFNVVCGVSVILSFWEKR